jgi:hypothetical protein
MCVLRIASVQKMPHRYGAGIITFQKLETLANNLVYVAAWYMAGRGNSLNRALLGPMLQHYKHMELTKLRISAQSPYRILYI